MTSRFLSSAKLVALMGLSTTTTTSVFGYTSSTINQQPFAKPFGLSSEQISKVLVVTPASEQNQRSTSQTTTTKTTYDLGLGKNKPLYGRGMDYLSSPVPEDATLFLVEHASVHNFPAPNSSDKTTATVVKPAGKTKQPLPVVQLQRKSEDVLLIYERVDVLTTESSSSSSSSSSPIIMPRSNTQLDLNTAWVEMFIYSEQAKLKLAIA
jgi:hypothetical protein